MKQKWVTWKFRRFTLPSYLHALLQFGSQHWINEIKNGGKLWNKLDKLITSIHFCFYRYSFISGTERLWNGCTQKVHSTFGIYHCRNISIPVSPWQNFVLRPLEVSDILFACRTSIDWYRIQCTLKILQIWESEAMGMGPVYIRVKYGNCSLNKGFRSLSCFIFSFLKNLFKHQTKLRGTYICNSQWWGFLYS